MRWVAIALAVLVCSAPLSRADYLEVSRSATLKDKPASEGIVVGRFSRGDVLRLVETAQSDGYYHAQPIAGGQEGWIYRTLVRRFSGQTPGTDGTTNLPLGPLGNGEMRAHFIDVGQGQATLLEFRCGAVLIDTGGEKNDDFDSTDHLLAYLNAFFAERADLHNTLDLVVLSHPHIDHTRGVSAVLDHFAVRNAVDNGQSGGSGGPQQALLEDHAQNSSDVGYAAISLSGISKTTGRTSTVIDPISCSDGDPKIRVLWGQVASDPGWGATEFGNPNNHSVVVRVDYGSASFLIPGDLEEKAQEDLVHRYAGTSLLDVDVYEVGHHGSRNGTTADLVSAMSPKVAVISMGPASRHRAWTAWKYGHPNTGTIQRIAAGLSMARTKIRVPVGSGAENFGDQDITAGIYATAWDGTVVVTARLDGAISIKTANQQQVVAGVNP